MNPPLIWWLSQAEYEAIGDRLLKGMPVYLRDQYIGRAGRPGRGRLWVDVQFGEVTVTPWPDTPLARFLGERYGGIVIREEDAMLLRSFPGIITDTSLVRPTL